MKNNQSFVRKYKHYSNRTIRNAIESIVVSCYGIARLSTKDLLSIDLKFKKPFKKEDAIVIKESANGVYTFDIYVSISYGVKLSEILSEVQKRVSYELKKAYGIKVGAVNVYAQTIDNGN